MKQITDKQRLDWISKCHKIDTSGEDTGWVFERFFYPGQDAKPFDVRFTFRGCEEDGLRKAIDAAIIADKFLGEASEVKG